MFRTLASRPMAGSRRAEVGRGERVLPGVWRLRLPLPLAGVPHCNAWALAAGDGIVLVDCGMDVPGSMGQLERALEQVGLRVEHVRLLVCTHAHIDHCGQADALQERTGCELWIHPRHEHLTARSDDPDAALARRVEVARQSGVPDAAAALGARRGAPSGIGLSGRCGRPATCVPGVTVETDLGTWDGPTRRPGTRPRTSCLHQPERRLLISGDHVLGRISLYFDHGWTPDPVGEFLASLDLVDAARRAPVARRPRAPVHRPARRTSRATARSCASGSTPSSRRCADAARRPPSSSAPPSTASAFDAEDGRLAADEDALLPHPPGALRARSAKLAASRGRSAGARAARLDSAPPMRIDERIAARGRSRPSRSSSSRPRPTRASATWAARSRSCRALAPDLRLRDLRRGRQHDAEAQDDRHRHATSSATTAWRRWRTSRASARPSRSCARCSTRCATRGSRTSSRCAATRRAGQTEWTATEGGLRYSRELIELIRDEYDFAIGAACFPEVHIHAHGRRERPALPQGEGRRGRALPDHAALLRQPAPTTTSSPGRATSASTSRSSRASCRSPNVAQIKRITEHVRRAILPGALLRELELRADEPGAVADLGVAYATLQCADLLANGAPGIHFYTLNRSPATRAILVRAAADGALARRRAGLSDKSVSHGFCRRATTASLCATCGRPSASQATSTWSSRR